MDVIYTHLDTWVNKNSLKYSINRWNKSNKLKDIEIRYEPFDILQIALIKDFKISIGDVISTNYNVNEATIKQKISISFESATERHINDFLNIIVDFREFLSFATLEPIWCVEIVAKSNKNMEECSGKKDFPGINVYIPHLALKDDINILDPLDILFTYKDIEENFESIFKNWLEKKSIIEPVYNLYLTVLYKKDRNLVVNFLQIIQAIETFHRRTRNNFELSEEEYNNKINSILDKVPEEYKQWLQDKLHYANEINLRKRLKELCREFPEVINSYIGHIRTFANQVYCSRNYYTHYDPQSEDQAVKGRELYYITQRLKLLLEICLLKEILLSNQEIKTLIDKNERYNYLICSN
jgi:hypothetical protein